MTGPKGGGGGTRSPARGMLSGARRTGWLKDCLRHKKSAGGGVDHLDVLLDILQVFGEQADDLPGVLPGVDSHNITLLRKADANVAWRAVGQRIGMP